MTEYALAHPLGSKQELAEWMGYDTEEEMDKDHDLVHQLLCRGIGVHSYSLDVADGKELTDDQYYLAHIEEAAVMLVQRLLQVYRKLNDGRS